MSGEPLTQEEYQQLLELGAINAKLDPKIKMQQEAAAQLRQNVGVPIRIGGYGGIAQAIGQLAQAGVAKRKDNMTQADQATRGDNATKQNQMIMAAILRGQQQPPPPAQLPSPMPQRPMPYMPDGNT